MAMMMFAFGDSKRRMRLMMLTVMMMMIALLGGGGTTAAAGVAVPAGGDGDAMMENIVEMKHHAGGKADEEQRRLETEFLEQELVFTVIPPSPIVSFQNLLSNVLSNLRSALHSLAFPIQQPDEFFERPEQYPDGFVNNAEFFTEFPALAAFYGGSTPLIRQNTYAWASDYNDTCKLGMMIHSGGTGLYASGSETSVSAPTITFRDETGQIVYHDYVWESEGETITDKQFPLLGTGIRAGLIVNCVGDMITIVIGVNSRLNFEGGAFGDIRRMTIDLNQVGADAISNYAITPIRAPSVRTLFQTGCLMTFSPLFDLLPADALVSCTDTPVLLTYDWCSATTPATPPDPPTGDDVPCSRRLVQEVEDSTTGKRHLEELPGALIWDFECEKDLDTCWMSLYDHQFDDTKLGGVDVFPNLYWFSKTDLTLDADIELHRVELTMNVDTAAHTLHHIDEDRVLACGLAAFVYYVEAAGGTDILLDINLEEIELGFPQECMVCSKQTNGCVGTGLPGLTSLTPYIWQAEKCGDYMFVGTYDINELSDVINAGLFELLGLSALQGIPFFWLSSLVKGLLFQDTVTPYDNGFDLWYIPLTELDAPVWNSFQPVTVNGFRKSDDPVNLGSSWPFDFAPDTPQEDGIRQLMCHDDKYLMIGTRVGGYSDPGPFEQSSSTWVLDTTSTLSSPSPVDPIRPSYFAILGSGLYLVILSLTQIVTFAYQGFVGGFGALVGLLPTPA